MKTEKHKTWRLGAKRLCCSNKLTGQHDECLGRSNLHSVGLGWESEDGICTATGEAIVLWEVFADLSPRGSASDSVESC